MAKSRTTKKSVSSAAKTLSRGTASKAKMSTAGKTLNQAAVAKKNRLSTAAKTLSNPSTTKAQRSKAAKILSGSQGRIVKPPAKKGSISKKRVSSAVKTVSSKKK